MSLSAIDDLTDAFAATKAFLLPFDAGRWAKLAVVVFFLGGTLGSGVSSDSGNVGDPGPGSPGTGGGVSGDGVDFSVSFDGTGATPGEAIESALGGFGAEITGIVVAVLALILLVGLAFRLVFFLAAAAVFVGLFLLVLGPLFFGGIARGVTAGLSVFVFLALIPVLLVLGLLAAVVNEFTAVFVVPIMMREHRGCCRPGGGSGG